MLPWSSEIFTETKNQRAASREELKEKKKHTGSISGLPCGPETYTKLHTMEMSLSALRNSPLNISWRPQQLSGAQLSWFGSSKAGTAYLPNLYKALVLNQALRSSPQALS